MDWYPFSIQVIVNLSMVHVLQFLLHAVWKWQTCLYNVLIMYILFCVCLSWLVPLKSSLYISVFFSADWIDKEPRKSWMTLSSASLNTSINPRSLALLRDRLKCDQHKCELSALQSCLSWWSLTTSVVYLCILYAYNQYMYK